MDYFINYWMSHYDMCADTYREKGRAVLESRKLRIILEDIDHFRKNFLYRKTWFLLFDIKSNNMNIIENNVQKTLNKYE